MTARVDAVVYFRIADPIVAVLKAENARESTFRISQSTLRDVLGTRSLAEILSEREIISEQLGVSVRPSHHSARHQSNAYFHILYVSRSYWMQPLTAGV